MKGRDPEDALISTLGLEKEINTFFRLTNPSVRRAVARHVPGPAGIPRSDDCLPEAARAEKRLVSAGFDVLRPVRGVTATARFAASHRVCSTSPQRPGSGRRGAPPAARLAPSRTGSVPPHHDTRATRRPRFAPSRTARAASRQLPVSGREGALPAARFAPLGAQRLIALGLCFAADGILTDRRRPRLCALRPYVAGR